jgi:hypothetical protein
MSAIRAHEEIIDFIAARTTPELVLAFRPSIEAQQRVQDLIRRRQEEDLTPDEQSELDDYLQLEHLMIMAKARARLNLRV